MAFALTHPSPVYHWKVYGVVPRRGFAVSTINWPLSTAGDDGVIVTVGSALTGKLTGPVDAGTPVPSVAETQ
jgi:hypothetical protein